MRKILIIIFVITITKLSFAQSHTADTLNMIKTSGVFNTLEYKSGYLINDYFVELTTSQFNEIKGKYVEITGKLLVIKGLDEFEKIKTQGSLNERKFIIKPEIKIIK